MESNRCRKRDVWRKIAASMKQDGYHFMSKQVEQKWCNLLREYKTVIDKKRQTGGKRPEFGFFDHMDLAVGKRHDINPPLRAGNGCAPVGEETPNIVHEQAVGDDNQGEPDEPPKTPQG